jgi:hypothetical protein
MTINNKRQSGSGFLGALVGGAAQAGKLWRETVQPSLNRFGDRIKEMQEGAGNVRAVVNSFTPDGREVRSQWEGLQARLKSGMSDAITGVKGVATITYQALSGMDQRIALCLLELHRLETTATEKSALGLTELVQAKTAFNTLKEKLEADPNALVEGQFDQLVHLFDLAKETLKKVPTNPPELRRAHLLVAGNLQEMVGLRREYAGAASQYADTFGDGAIANRLQAADVDAFQERLASIGTTIRSDDPMAASIGLIGLSSEIERRKEEYAVQLKKFSDDTRTLSSLDAVMRNLLDEAEANHLSNRPEILAQGRLFIKNTRSKPVDLAAAEAAKDEYAALVETALGLS